MTAHERRWSPVGLALSCVLAALALCLHADSQLLRYYELEGVSALFVFAFLCGVAVLCAAVLVSSHDAEQRRWSIGMGLATGGTGAAFGLFVQMLPPAISAAGSGALLGFGLTCLLRQWGRFYRLLSFQGALLNTALAFLVASCLWLAVSHAGTPFLFCLGVLTLVFCGGLPLLARQIVHAGEDAPAPSPTVEALAGSFATLHQVMRMGWAAAVGLAFNFFMIGLTFWPEAVEVEAGGLSPKPFAYAALAIAVWWVVSRTRKPVSDVLETFYRVSLPAAAAIMLACAFGGAVAPSSYAAACSLLTYVGVAICNVLGLVILFWTAKCSEVGFSKVFAVYCASCAGAVAAGMVAFHLLGSDVYAVSLALLVCYLAAMILGEVRRGFNRRCATRGVDGERESLFEPCSALSERYGLSVSESKILPFLARGRGAKHIAGKLRISPEAVRAHCKRIYEKTGVHAQEELLDLIEEFE